MTLTTLTSSTLGSICVLVSLSAGAWTTPRHEVSRPLTMERAKSPKLPFSKFTCVVYTGRVQKKMGWVTGLF